MIYVAQLSARVEQKCSRHAHHAPAAGKFWLFGCIHFDNMQVVIKHLAQLLDGWTLYCLARNTGRSGEIDQGEGSGANWSKIGKQIAGTELERPVVKQINAKAAKNDSNCESGADEDIRIEHIL